MAKDILIVSGDIWVGDRYTIRIPAKVTVKTLPPLTSDPPPPRDWPAAWLVKWRDR